MTTEATTSTTAEFMPPYIAFRTLMDIVKRMADEEPPSRIDKSYLHNYSGGYQTQVLAALTSLGLIDATGKLQPTLLSIVAADEAERKVLMAELVRELFKPVLDLGTSATQQMMLDTFSALAPKVTGDTRRKAVAFFLSACAYCAIPVSRHWKTPRVAPSGKPRKPKAAATGIDGELDGTEQDEGDERVPYPRANVRELELRSGGVVGLSLSVDLFALTADDRKFVFGLIDSMSAYENERILAAPGSPAPATSPLTLEDEP